MFIYIITIYIYIYFQRPGNYFGVGSHQIIYTGFDAAGYTAKCVFKIIVVASKRSIAKVPLPFFYLFDIN